MVRGQANGRLRYLSTSVKVLGGCEQYLPGRRRRRGQDSFGRAGNFRAENRGGNCGQDLRNATERNGQRAEGGVRFRVTGYKGVLFRCCGASDIATGDSWKVGMLASST